MNAYDTKFFDRRSKEGEIADTILQVVLPLTRPSSIVDLGTAVGTWLQSAKRAGISTVVGVDGPWVPDDQKLIGAEEFVSADLEAALPDLGRYDLAICTEVLEHLTVPAAERAVEWLCKRAPVILFSAAIPDQGGDAHINEQWQSHWLNLFAMNGYQTYDVVRPRIWENTSIPFWYRQNLFLMAPEHVGSKEGWALANKAFMNFVHPDSLGEKARRIEFLERKLKERSLKGRLQALRQALGGK